MQKKQLRTFYNNKFISDPAPQLIIMNYWIFITSHKNWEVTIEKNVLGVAERHRNAISKVHVGDLCLVYVKQAETQASVRGTFEVTSEMYVDETQIFEPTPYKPHEIFPLRLDVKYLTPSAAPIAFIPLVPKLSFIKNKQHWSGTLQGNALLNIPKRDYLLIASLIHHDAAPSRTF